MQTKGIPWISKFSFFSIHKQLWVLKHIGFTVSAFWGFPEQLLWLSLHIFIANIPLKALFFTNYEISEQWYRIEKVWKVQKNSVSRVRWEKDIV